MKRFIIMISMLLAAAAGMAVPAIPASAASTPAKSTYCVVEIAPLTRSEMSSLTNHESSRIISRSCSHQAAKVGFIMPGSSPTHAASTHAASAAASSYPLWTGWQYTNYKGDGVQFKGPHECSLTAGYAIADTRPYDNGAGSWGISSWKASSDCYHTTIYTDYEWGGSEYTYAQGVWEAGQIGSPWDNHVWSIYTREE
jgi:hypothetical protein